MSQDLDYFTPEKYIKELQTAADALFAQLDFSDEEAKRKRAVVDGILASRIAALRAFAADGGERVASAEIRVDLTHAFSTVAADRVVCSGWDGLVTSFGGGLPSSGVNVGSRTTPSPGVDEQFRFSADKALKVKLDSGNSH